MSETDIFLKLKEIMENHFGEKGLQIDKNSELVNELDIDSIKMFEVILDLEEVFVIEVSDEDSEYLTTVNNIIDYIKNKKGWLINPSFLIFIKLF